MKIFIILLFLIKLILANEIHNTAIHTAGYIKGEDFLIHLNDNEKKFYLMGLIDGFLVDKFTQEVSKKWTNEFSLFLSNKSATQIIAILTQYIEKHPEKWDLPTSLLFMNSISEVSKLSIHNFK